MRVIVVGAGAIGGWLGGRLAMQKHNVTLVGRAPLAEAVAAHGLRLLTPDEEFVLRDVNIATSLADAVPHGPFDLALFTVKTYDTNAAIAGMRQAFALWSNPVTILSLQNGVRSEEALAAAFGADHVLAGTILNPISVLQAGQIRLEKYKGGIGLAPLIPGGEIERWAQVLDVLPTRVYADYRAMKWSKLLLNLIGNASAAILDMSSVEVFADPQLFSLELEMLRECVAVMRGLGIPPVGLPGYPLPLLAWALRSAPRWALGPIMRKLVSGGRGHKPPSLLLSLRAGKRRSEVDDLNGAVVRGGQKSSTPTPVNRALTETLGRVVDGRIKWEGIRRQPGALLAIVAEFKRKAA